MSSTADTRSTIGRANQYRTSSRTAPSKVVLTARRDLTWGPYRGRSRGRSRFNRGLVAAVLHARAVIAWCESRQPGKTIESIERPCPTVLSSPRCRSRGQEDEEHAPLRAFEMSSRCLGLNWRSTIYDGKSNTYIDANPRDASATSRPDDVDPHAASHIFVHEPRSDRSRTSRRRGCRRVLNAALTTRS